MAASTSGQHGGYPSGVYSDYAYGDPYPYSHQHYYPPQPPANLQQCRATGCAKPVHWEPDVLGDFNYCSPECRNKHLLPIEKDQLKADLEELAEQLRVAAVTDNHICTASG